MLQRWILSLLVILLLVSSTSAMANTSEGKFNKISLDDHISDSSDLLLTNLTLSAPGYTNRMLQMDSVLESMQSIGIPTESFYKTMDILFPMTFGHSDRPVPVFENGGFDILSSRRSSSLLDDYSNLFIPGELYNVAGVNNPEINNTLQRYQTTTDVTERTQLAYKLQQLFYETKSVIPVYHEADKVLYENGLNIDQSDLISMINDGKFGLGWQSISHDLTDTIGIDTPYWMGNVLPFFINSLPERLAHDAIFSGLFSTMHDDISNDFITPVLAADDGTWTGSSLQVQINPDAKFSNGNEVEAWDVVNSYRYFLTIGMTNSYGLENHLDDVSDISLVDDTTIQFDFDKRSHQVYEILDLGIMDDEVIKNYTSGVQPIYTDGTTSDLGIAISNPSSTFENNQETYAIGAGPYILDSVTTDLTHLIATPNYWNGEVGASDVNIYYNVASKQTKLDNGDLHMLIADGFYNVDLYSGSQTTTELVPTFGLNFIMINLNHPVLGTGLETPLGKEDPSQAAFAAQKARTALSYLIDYDYILNQVYNGEGFLSPSIWSPYARDYADSLPELEYNPEKALNLLNEIGYFYPEDYPQLHNLIAPSSLEGGQTFDVSVEYDLGTGNFSAATVFIKSSSGTSEYSMNGNSSYASVEIPEQSSGETLSLWVEVENSIGAKNSTEVMTINVEGFSILSTNYFIVMFAGLFILQVVIRRRN